MTRIRARFFTLLRLRMYVWAVLIAHLPLSSLSHRKDLI